MLLYIFQYKESLYLKILEISERCLAHEAAAQCVAVAVGSSSSNSRSSDNSSSCNHCHPPNSISLLHCFISSAQWSVRDQGQRS